MENSNRTGYIDFSTKICGLDTEIKILETLTHVFIYINQEEEKIHLYDTDLRKELIKRDIKRTKKMIIFCNLKDTECLKQVSTLLYDIFTK